MGLFWGGRPIWRHQITHTDLTGNRTRAKFHLINGLQVLYVRTYVVVHLGITAGAPALFQQQQQQQHHYSRSCRGSEAFIRVCVSVCVYLHDRTKTAETTITKLGIVYQFNIRSKVTGSQSAKTYFSWRRLSGRRELALYRAASV